MATAADPESVGGTAATDLCPETPDPSPAEAPERWFQPRSVRWRSWRSRRRRGGRGAGGTESHSPPLSLLLRTLGSSGIFRSDGGGGGDELWPQFPGPASRVRLRRGFATAVSEDRRSGSEGPGSLGGAPAAAATAAAAAGTGASSVAPILR